MTTPTTNLQQSPYLREQRQFPYDDLKELANQSDHAYIDIAQKVNARTIGIYANRFPLVTGNRWFLSGSSQSQQTLRQVYQFTAAGAIPHGINFNSISQFVQGYGSYTDGTNPLTNNYYGVIYGTSVALAGQVTFWIDPTNINVIVGAGAPVPASGTIIIEWLSNY